jgi:hypothetical protein
MEPKLIAHALRAGDIGENVAHIKDNDNRPI